MKMSSSKKKKSAQAKEFKKLSLDWQIRILNEKYNCDVTMLTRSELRKLIDIESNGAEGKEA